MDIILDNTAKAQVAGWAHNQKMKNDPEYRENYLKTRRAELEEAERIKQQKRAEEGLQARQRSIAYARSGFVTLFLITSFFVALSLIGLIFDKELYRFFGMAPTAIIMVVSLAYAMEILPNDRNEERELEWTQAGVWVPIIAGFFIHHFVSHFLL